MAKINGDGDNGLKKVTGREEDDLGPLFASFFCEELQLLAVETRKK
jgi:hypothetical protein